MPAYVADWFRYLRDRAVGNAVMNPSELPESAWMWNNGVLNEAGFVINSEAF